MTAITLILGLALVTASATRGDPADEARQTEAACIAARVHYEPGPDRDLRRMPWIVAGRPGRKIIGYLFYYVPELRVTDRMRIYVDGQLPGGTAATKILWIPRKVGSSVLTVDGLQLDGDGRFQQDFQVADAGRPVFPSIVEVPRAGCWRLTVRNGAVSARFAVIAVA